MANFTMIRMKAHPPTMRTDMTDALQVSSLLVPKWPCSEGHGEGGQKGFEIAVSSIDEVGSRT